MYYFLIALINFLAFLIFFRYDTPNYYNTRGNDKETNKLRYEALLEIHNLNNAMSELMLLDNLKKTQKKTSLKDLFTKKFWVYNKKVLLVGIVIANLSHAVGANVLNIYSSSIIEKNDGKDDAILFTVIIGAADFASCFFTWKIIPSFGRYTSYIEKRGGKKIYLIILTDFLIPSFLHT